MSKKLFMKIAAIIGIVVSFALLLKLDYTMYSTGKRIIFCADIYLVYYILTTVLGEIKWRSLALIGVMVLINPIIPIVFAKSTRQIIDVVSGIVLLITYVLLNKEQFKNLKIITK